MKKIIGKLSWVIIPLLAAVFLLYPTYESSRLEDIQKKYEKRALAAEKAQKPDEALRIRSEFQKAYGDDLKKAKENKLKLGLDLRGGMYVTLEVDIVKLIEESAVKEAVDETFEAVIEKTAKEAKSSDEEVLDIFLKNFNSIARPKGKSLINYFDIGDLKDASEDKIVEKLQDNATKSIDQALEVIRQRIDKYGVAEPNIQKQGTRRILLELPGVQDENQMRNLLQTTARLEFKLVRNNAQIIRTFYKIDQLLVRERNRRMGKIDTTVIAPDTLMAAQEAPKKVDSAKIAKADKKDTTATKDTTVAATDTAKPDTSNPYAGLKEEEAVRRYQSDHPFTSLFATYFMPGPDQRPAPVSYVQNNFPEGEYMFRISGDSIAKFEAYLRRHDVKALMPFDLELAVSAKPDRMMEKQNIEVFDLYCLKKDPELTGDVITDARASFDPTTNTPEVLMGMNDDGSDRWARITGANLKKRISIVLDGRVYSAPVVQSKITGGRSSITGMANAEEANLLEIVLKAGALKAPVEIIQERVVGPSLGEDSISKGLNASMIAFMLVILYMIMYYGAGGAIADFAVILNVVLIVSVMSSIGSTLTLPGIAGIILTVGMAVDANVLIFERIREELHKGRSMRSAVDEGFSKALSAIIDSNVTTFLTSLILYFLGTGPIQGFAVTLMIGIFGTLFTAIVVSKAIIEIFITRGTEHFSFGQPKPVKV